MGATCQMEDGNCMDQGKQHTTQPQQMKFRNTSTNFKDFSLKAVNPTINQKIGQK